MTGAPDAQTRFEEELKEGDNAEFKLPLLPKAGLSFAPLAVDRTSTRLAARGIVFDGEAFVTEDYSRLATPLPDIGNLVVNTLQEQLNKWDGELGDKFKQGIEETQSVAGKVHRATKAVFGPTPDDASLSSFPAEPAAPNGAPYRGNSDVVPAGKPRYGIGDFYSLTSETPPSAPIDVAITYTDAEIVGLDESTIGLFKWNSAIADWTPLPSVLDAQANRVTASVTTTGLFTLGVRMPAGKLAWQGSNWLVTGSGAGVRTSVTAVATGLRANVGAALPAGTLVHVDLPDIADADITYVTPDAAPAMPGMQVAAAADGSVSVTVSVRGTRGRITIVGFSDIGTAFGQATVERP